VKSPEQTLWRSVIDQALSDACGVGIRCGVTESVSSALRRSARAWFWHKTEDFRDVCDMAGMDPNAVRDRAIKLMNANKKHPRTRLMVGREMVA